ncbi:bifunctional PIG-L family deacetylase/class I SAM-dependent methyltransferase [Zobellia galactanivorans]|uniref:bifunctional PIG-L family deacetylase/class I SAM-dependent methyltransferase n=1 Tax=Zobellia galactanivorans (strain DSM 12802 / CCUG 47099 / CIP 106680 / NCIMB 13871 / Dsij) TaxID=63186 RepID=UPI0026E31DBB|nr:bifunctional PIG-L family deacetylase/class I SAM-dependent methyltransferase [Zobellia galactanivorans]MDO6810946.1 bifunctional PIG-L family deacetylase/class I SAM-dependent methyltransferase [Zobellia galactanivorans]
MDNKVQQEAIFEAPYLNIEGLSRDIGKLLILAPHPDDESLACGGIISLLIASGVQVHIIFFTSGSASHPESELYPAERLANLREQEALLACKCLGIPADHIDFFREKDSDMCNLSPKRRNQLGAIIAKKCNNESFLTLGLPWRRDPHADHKVVYDIGKRSFPFLESPTIVMEYPVWMWKNGERTDWPGHGEILPFRLDISTVFNRKLKAIHVYKSQLGKVVLDDPNGFVLTPTLLAPFLTDTEYFFLTKLGTIQKIDEDYFESLYQGCKDPWDFSTSTYELEKYEYSVTSLGNTNFNTVLEIGCSIGVQTEKLARCSNDLLAVDISRTAIYEAKKRYGHLENVRFEVCDVTTSFPSDCFDLISFCEVGYYFDEDILLELFNNIKQSLINGGKLLMVHWTPFVPGYPLTGKQVHDLFTKYVAENGDFYQITNEDLDKFSLQIWKKV